ncbi:MAG: twin-arginine translocase TatA/TatE family subunit [Acidobacteriaceae bacterium]|nr:twin-arginine translocase TatA/TatE family subunit [Acidobacteriaceae bacterium]
MGPIGAQEMIFIFVLALVLFGPKKLPELGRLVGKGLTEFRRAKNELKTTFESHMRELEREANLEKYSSTEYKPDYSSPRQSYPYDEYGQEPQPGTTSEHSYNTPGISEPPSEAASAPPAHLPVNGTVARSNSAQPVEHVAGEEQHPA